VATTTRPCAVPTASCAPSQRSASAVSGCRSPSAAPGTPDRPRNARAKPSRPAETTHAPSGDTSTASTGRRPAFTRCAHSRFGEPVRSMALSTASSPVRVAKATSSPWRLPPTAVARPPASSTASRRSCFTSPERYVSPRARSWSCSAVSGALDAQPPARRSQRAAAPALAATGRLGRLGGDLVDALVVDGEEEQRALRLPALAHVRLPAGALEVLQPGQRRAELLAGLGPALLDDGAHHGPGV